MDMKPLSEHRWLHRLEGEWQFEGASLMGPGEDREVFSGYENVRRLGDFWIVAENEIVVDGETGRNIITLGFDAFRKQFVGTWVGSMMSALWTYRGSLDSTEKILMLETEGPSFEKEGHMAKYRDLLEMIDADTRRLQSFALSENGRWREFMNADYRRRRQ